MAPVSFNVVHDFDAPPRALWDELVDWKAHEAWIPMTRMELDPGDPTAVGATFTAFTGLGPLALEDRMRVAECDWDEASESGICVVDKLGPVLSGRAGFTVSATPDGSRIDWFEDVEVKYLPGFVAPVAARIGASGFRQGMKRLAKALAQPAGTPGEDS